MIREHEHHQFIIRALAQEHTDTMASYPTLVALFWVFFSAARGAPTGSGSSSLSGPWVGACFAVKESSAMFNGVAREVSAEAEIIIPNKGHFDSSLVWMEAKDMCDPASLHHKSLPCVGKLLSVLEGYSSAVETVSNITVCSALAVKVKPVLHNLHRELSSCVTSMGGSVRMRMKEGRKTVPSSQNSDTHKDTEKEKVLCRYVMERLFSFSIITARVFAEGDPAHHSGLPHKCV